MSVKLYNEKGMHAYSGTALILTFKELVAMKNFMSI